MASIEYIVSERVKMTTDHDKHGVHYGVLVDGHRRWYKYVRFGRSPRYHAGGPAFVEASREQEEFARAASLRDDRSV
jgi:hypothetical protein